MIPIAAINPLLRYFDAIDENCTQGLMNKKPHIETTTTQNLCSLLDAEEQKQFNLSYYFVDLEKDLSTVPGGLSVDICTHEYNSSVESKVTQSDLGLIINYINHYKPDLCWTESWLFQAKSLKPDIENPVTYTSKSKFKSFSQPQIDRIKKLKHIVKPDFIRFMEYCPRVGLLDLLVQDELICYRNFALVNDIFDYALGLELRDCLLREDKNLEPGIFISDIEGDTKSKSYLDLYKNFWKKSYPFSWFILRRLTTSFDDLEYRSEDQNQINRIKINKENLIPEFDESSVNPAALAHAIVRCDQNVADYVLRQLGNYEGNFTFYPERTITIDIRIGRD